MILTEVELRSIAKNGVDKVKVNERKTRSSVRTIDVERLIDCPRKRMTRLTVLNEWMLAEA
jgi:hypothetical protein